MMGRNDLDAGGRPCDHRASCAAPQQVTHPQDRFLDFGGRGNGSLPALDGVASPSEHSLGTTRPLRPDAAELAGERAIPG